MWNIISGTNSKMMQMKPSKVDFYKQYKDIKMTSWTAVTPAVEKCVCIKILAPVGLTLFLASFK